MELNALFLNSGVLVMLENKDCGEEAMIFPVIEA